MIIEDKIRKKYYNSNDDCNFVSGVTAEKVKQLRLNTLHKSEFFSIWVEQFHVIELEVVSMQILCVHKTLKRVTSH